MNLKNKYTNVLLKIKKLPLPVLISGGVVLVLIITLLGVFLFKKPVNFSYADTTCVSQFMIAPDAIKQRGDIPYAVRFDGPIQVFGKTIASTKVCFEPTAAPLKGESTIGVSLFGWPLFVKQFALKVGDPPVARTQDFISQTLPTTRPLEISLSAADEIYDYQLLANEREVVCDHEDRSLQCDMTELALAQGAEYKARLERSFKQDVPQLVAEGSFKTLKPLQLTAASVESGKVLYDKTKEFSFTYDKAPVISEVELKTEAGVLATSVRRDDKTVFVTATEELPRNTKFSLTLKKIEAADGTALSEPYAVNFETGGGPKVTGVNYGSVSAPTSGMIIIQFDQPIAKINEALKNIVVQGVAAGVTISGAQVRLSYQADLCQSINVTIKKGLENEHGIVQDQDWSYATRTKCHTTQVIGYSQQGRAIVAYIFGSGAKKVLFTGALHGNERNTRSLLDAWIGELETRAQDIPAGTRVVVIPLLNPDGYAANTRTNSRNVDLNRNFDTTDWKKDIDNVYGQPFPGGGGESAMSEVESQVIANYTMQLQPALTMSYHSVAGYAIANTCGESASRAQTYASVSGYRNMTGVGGAFDYEITGTYDDWICQRLGLASVLIELASTTSAEFSRNRAAMWQMVRL